MSDIDSVGSAPKTDWSTKQDRVRSMSTYPTLSTCDQEKRPLTEDQEVLLLELQ